MNLVRQPQTAHHEDTKVTKPHEETCTKYSSCLRESSSLRAKPWLIASATTAAYWIAAALGAAPAPSTPIFIESAAATGLAFTHVNGATGKYYLPEMMGAGVALFDYDNDGDLDVFLVQSGAIDMGQGASAGCRLFRNDLTVSADGRRTLHFTDVTK